MVCVAQMPLACLPLCCCIVSQKCNVVLRNLRPSHASRTHGLPLRTGVLRIYDMHEAQGRDVLQRFEAGRFREELLLAYVVLQAESMEAILLTDQTLAVMQVCTLERRFKVKVAEIESAVTKGSGVLVTIKPPAATSSKYFSEAIGVSVAVRERVLPCGDLEKAEFLVSTIKAACLAVAQA